MTPIEQTRNLGPIAAEELRVLGITSREQLVDAGWEDAFVRLVRAFPARLNVNMCCALIGAIEDVDWREVAPREKAAAQELVRSLRRSRC